MPLPETETETETESNIKFTQTLCQNSKHIQSLKERYATLFSIF